MVGVQCDFCKRFYKSRIARMMWTESDDHYFAFDVCDECAEAGLSLKRVDKKGSWLSPDKRALTFGHSSDTDQLPEKIEDDL